MDVVLADESGNLLPQAETRSRVPDDSGTFAGHPVKITPTVLPNVPLDGMHELAAMVFHVDAPDGQTAIGAATPAIEDLLETFSFQLQQIIPSVQVEAIDVTAPAAAGDERDAVLFPYPHGLPLPKFSSSIQMGGVVTPLIPAVAALSPVDSKAEAALGWHLKAMASPFSAEQFMLNWIALEILWRRSGVSVETHYPAKCGHEIEDCPVCGKPTAREVRGASIRKYLVEIAGVPEAQASRMWRIRQMFHGDVAFDSAEMEELPLLIQVLRAVIVNELKRALGVAEDQPPFASAGNLAVGAQFALGIRRALRDEDLT